MPALVTDNEKLSIMEWCAIWEPALPLSPGALDQADQQQLLNDFSGILWGAITVVVGNLILDLNTRLYVYLNTFYAYSPPVDLTTLVPRYLAEEKTGDYNGRMLQLIDDATA